MLREDYCFVHLIRFSGAFRVSIKASIEVEVKYNEQWIGRSGVVARPDRRLHREASQPCHPADLGLPYPHG